MSALQDTLEQGLRWQREGRLAEAARCYRRVLEHQPDNPDALHLLGMVEYASGRPEAALGLIAQAIRSRPDVAAFHNNLGNALLASGRPEQACLAFEEALRLTPRYAEALVNYGNALQQLQRWEEAVAVLVRAVELEPELPEAYNNLGNALAGRGDLEAAAACLGEALRRQPDYAEAWLNLAHVRRKQQRLEEAAECCRQALRLAPEFFQAHVALAAVLAALGQTAAAERAAREAVRLRPQDPDGWAQRAMCLLEQGRHRAAAACAQQALRLRPEHPQAWNNLGAALMELGCHEAAADCFREAIRLKPDLADAHYNLGNVHREARDPAHALACYEEALRCEPKHVRARWNRALTLLSVGDWERGFEEFEWRWKMPFLRPRPFAQPLWDGTPLDGRTILLYAEQGLGDVIHFVRFARQVQACGGRVLLESPRALVGLLASAPGIDELVAAGDALPPFDVQAPLMSLPRILKLTSQTLPPSVPYLHADPARREAWERRFRALGGLRVGLVWAGNPQHAHDRRRSLALDVLAPLGRIPGVHFVGLQYGPRSCQGLAPPEGLTFLHLGPELGDFGEAAAAVAALDLVISVDTAMAHLAGALGCPVWVLLAFVPDWRWGLEGETTPWY
ncbi:MAG: tetratricopeptide repeat protein, partial [Bryobacteraceae bacterium]|nr:tetratricopeptide repeat protein [Bryobacteraceae bacterium]